MTTYNGLVVPTISADAGLVGYRSKRVKSYGTKVKEFLNSQDFQDFCNLETNGIYDGSLLWIVRCEYPLEEVVGVNGEIAFDFDVITGDVPYLYKATRFVNKADAGEKQISFSQSFIVRRNGQGRWSAELILKNDDWLKRDEVRNAFVAIASAQGYHLTGGIGVYKVKFRAIDTQAWVSVAMSGKGEGRLLVCLLDSGRIVDLATNEAELQKTPLYRIIKTKFNWFGYNDENKLTRS